MSSLRGQTLVLLLTVASVALHATVGYPAGLEALKARQCCARQCPRRSDATPQRRGCCSQLASDGQLGVTTRLIVPLSAGPVLFSSRDAQPAPVVVARLFAAVDTGAVGPPLFLLTHHIQR